MAYLIIVLATLSRFIPHLWNFSPVYGALLFGGANMKKRDSIWFSAVTLGASDIVLTKFIYHFDVGWGELVQMAAFASIAMIGWILQKRFSIGRLAFACLAAPTSFYLISDFGVWLGFNSYPHTWNGLVMLCGCDPVSGPHNRQHGVVRGNPFRGAANPRCSRRTTEAVAGNREIASAEGARNENMFVSAFEHRGPVCPRPRRFGVRRHFRMRLSRGSSQQAGGGLQQTPGRLARKRN